MELWKSLQESTPQKKSENYENWHDGISFRDIHLGSERSLAMLTMQ